MVPDSTHCQFARAAASKIYKGLAIQGAHYTRGSVHSAQYTAARYIAGSSHKRLRYMSGRHIIASEHKRALYKWPVYTADPHTASAYTAAAPVPRARIQRARIQRARITSERVYKGPVYGEPAHSGARIQRAHTASPHRGRRRARGCQLLEVKRKLPEKMTG